MDANNVPLALGAAYRDRLAAQCWLWKDHTGIPEAEAITAIAKRLRPQYLAKIGGSISAEHGIGLEKKPYLHLSRNPAEIALMRTLKNTLDANNILNPGKIF